ncbi:MAG: ABC transporter ATP-binding protein [Kiritimatiellae bacterium]|nr:ABC transporter ATP-binding protein [Kiritimatiellia bacterium]
MNEDGSKSTFSAYQRLVAYIRPYWSRVLIGIFAGFFCGSASFGLLSAIPQVIKPIENATAIVSSSPLPEKSSEHKSSKLENRLIDKARKWGLISSEKNQVTRQGLIVILLIAPPLILLRSLAMYLNKYWIRWVGARVVRDLRDELFNRLQTQSLKFFGKSDVGQLISKCTNDTTSVEQVLSVTVADLTRAPFEIGAALIFVMLFTFKNDMLGLLVLCLLVFPICVMPIVMLGKRLKRYSHTALGRISELVSRMHENFTGIRVVKAFHMEKKEFERFRIMNSNYFRAVIKALRAELLMSPAMEAVAGLLSLVFLVVCYVKGITIGQIIAVGMAGVMAYRPVKGLVQINANLQRGAAALDRIFVVLDTNTAIREATHPVSVNKFTEKMVFEKVNFTYSESGPMIVHDISFNILKGSVVALVGETGSGKTTLANLLARFYDPTDGRITLDGVDLKDIEIASLRKLIGVVTQETIIFNDTIASNIAYGTEEVSREQIIEAAKKANAHDFIMGDPKGYERIAGEKGFVLSGGERQRIAIARAILRNPPILILDEATSALDTVTERLVQEAIARVMQDRTVFAIAHRLSTVKNADLILVLDHGRIIERGTHDQLMAVGGIYRKLCDMQFGLT